MSTSDHEEDLPDDVVADVLNEDGGKQEDENEQTEELGTIEDTEVPDEETKEENEPDELDEMQKKMKETMEEAEKLKELQEQSAALQKEYESSAVKPESDDANARSIYVGQVDYQATAEELEEHFSSCGAINKLTILCDKYTGHPKGFAYVEFSEEEAVANAMLLNESLFRGRQLKVAPKRANVPGYGRGRGRGGYRGRFRGRGRGYRSRGFHPYWS